MLDKRDLEQIRGIVRTEVRAEIKEELRPVKADLTKVRRDVDAILGLFDREYLELRSRVERIEEVLHLQPLKAKL